LGYSGHLDYLEKNFPGLWDSSGQVRTDRVWASIKKAYLSNSCPEY
jgi:hypothetical protein